MNFLKRVAYSLPVAGRILEERRSLHVSHQALAQRISELETQQRDALRALHAAETARHDVQRRLEIGEADRLDVNARLEQAQVARDDVQRRLDASESEKWNAIRQREQAESARWEAVRDREKADAARWEAERQREEAEDARWEAVRQRERVESPSSDGAPLKRGDLSSGVNWHDRPHLERQGLFVVGHARSGTSILMRALNSSPEIFLLGEAGLYQQGLRPHFADWYNTMHRQLDNARAKDSYCPPAPHESSNGVEALDWLSRRYRYIGEKVAFRSERLGYYNLQRFFDFQAQHFGKSHYICIVRDPKHALKSNIEKFEPSDQSMYSESYVATLSLIADMYDIFPNTLVLSHEHITASTFDVIGARLGIDLSSGFALYEHEKFRRDSIEQFSFPHEALVYEAYNKFTNAFSTATLSIIDFKELRKLQQGLAAIARTLAA